MYVCVSVCLPACLLFAAVDCYLDDAEKEYRRTMTRRKKRRIIFGVEWIEEKEEKAEEEL